MTTPPQIDGARHCTHHFCQCFEASKLLHILDRTGEVRYLLQAIACHDRTVPCQMYVERKGETDGR